MSIIHLTAVSSEEPTAADLAAIETEWPLIAAQLDVLNAEIAVLSAGPHVSVLDRRRVRRAEHRVLSVRRRLSYVEGVPLPCGCHGNTVLSTMRDGGQMCGACGSTWDRHDQIVTFYGIDGAGDAA